MSPGVLNFDVPICEGCTGISGVLRRWGMLFTTLLSLAATITAKLSMNEHLHGHIDMNLDMNTHKNIFMSICITIDTNIHISI